MLNPYTEPVSKLLKLGRPEESWQDYLALGITPNDIPELIRLVEDHEMRIMEPPADLPDDEDLPEWYAQIHAWRALGQLKAVEAIPSILGILHQVDDEDDDWIGEDAEDVFAKIGPTAIDPIAEYLRDDTKELYARVETAKSLHAIGKAHPETRDECARILASVLENYKENDEGLNGFIIYDLVRLGAVEYIDLIERAFKSESVDEMIMGDFEDVQVELGLIEERITKPARPPFFERLHQRDKIFEPERKASYAKKKEKNKRKQEKKSRKKNRKRK
jgi:HEAT repeat protein